MNLGRGCWKRAVLLEGAAMIKTRYLHALMWTAKLKPTADCHILAVARQGYDEAQDQYTRQLRVRSQCRWQTDISVCRLRRSEQLDRSERRAIAMVVIFLWV